MKKQLLIISLVLAWALSSKAQWSSFDSVTFENKSTKLIRMDTAKSNIWQIGKPRKTFFDSAYSKPNAIVTDTVGFYPVNNTSYFILALPGTETVFNHWDNCAVPWVTFWQKFDTDTLQDSGYIDISVDGEKTWVKLDSFCVMTVNCQVTGHSNGWVQGQIIFTPATGCGSNHWFPTCDTAFLRFTFHSGSTVANREGWMIDNIFINQNICEGIPEYKSGYANMSIYPNPANGSVTLSYQLSNNEPNAQLNLYSPLGQLLKCEVISATSGTVEENVVGLFNGIYYYTLTVGGVVEATNKLVIIK